MEFLSVEAWRDIFINSLTSLWAKVANFAPNLIGALFILVIGYFISKFLARVFQSILARLGFDKLCDRTGIERALRSSGIEKTGSQIVALIIFWLIIAVSIEHVIMDGMSFRQGVSIYINEEDIARDTLFAMIMAMVLIIIGKIRLLHYTPELLSLFTGKYYYPEEEVRTIMFVDLAGSTSIAEELGTIRFSSFLKDWFSDISESIFAWRGQVYQYLGDGFILSWRKKYDKSGIFPINCFYDMQRIINEKQEYYPLAELKLLL